MCHHPVRPSIEPRVSLLVPNLYVRKPRVTALRFDEQSSNHARSPFDSIQKTRFAAATAMCR